MSFQQHHTSHTHHTINPTKQVISRLFAKGNINLHPSLEILNPFATVYTIAEESESFDFLVLLLGSIACVMVVINARVLFSESRQIVNDQLQPTGLQATGPGVTQSVAAGHDVAGEPPDSATEESP